MKNFCINIIFLFILLINIYKIKSVYIYIEPNEKKCLSEKKLANSTFNVIFSISGLEETQNIITVNNPNHSNLLTLKNIKSKTINVKTDKPGDYYFCVENVSKSKITLTFQFENEERETDMVSIQSVEYFVSGVHILEKKLDRLNFNVGNSAVRKKTHFNISNSIRNKINIYAIIKIIFLVIFSLFQIFMITSVFRNIKQVNKILGVNPEKKPLVRKRRRSSGDYI